MDVPEITNNNGLRMRLGSIVLVKHSRLASWEGVVEGICWEKKTVYIFYKDYDRQRKPEDVDSVEIVMVFWRNLHKIQNNSHKLE